MHERLLTTTSLSGYIGALRTNTFQFPIVNRRGIVTSVINQSRLSHDIRTASEIDWQKSFNQEVFNKSIALSRSRMNDATELRCALFDINGCVEMADTHTTKAEIMKHYGIDARDLRNVDLVSEGIPHVVVRPSTIFLSIFSLRLLVQCDRVLLFHLDTEGTGVKMQDIFQHDLQSKLRADGSASVTSLPYELRVLDAALASVTAMLEAEYLLMQEEVQKRMREMKEEDAVYTALREALESGKKLGVIEQRARQVRSALQELLNNDEDMAAMYLSDRKAGRPHDIKDHQDLEYLLEAYYKNADAIAESANALVKDVNRTARTVKSILDVRRNQIMIFEAQLEIWMLGFAMSTFVAGLFGMNVINYLEDSKSAFIVLVSACALGTVLLSRFGIWKLKKFRKLQL
ncbi:hypothetical protein N7495_002835 [Penicillium taxi]|uniref:uncharacterized protein n=1 Tax=Penicillium taxi TaxID=168475 RepID=UPI0025457DF4|nr:uncharacterized protein N7495_002835 [Penicillium taxi]KAJ5902307.1 hypothetical protein N7495_002835 [Penicillium taxi]